MSYSIIKQSGQATIYLKEFLVDTIAEIESLPKFPDCSYGSRCLVIENSKEYILSNNNQWRVLNQGSQPSPTPSVLTNIILEDEQTGNLYKLGIENGVIYLDSEVESGAVAENIKITDDITGIEYTLKVENQNLLIES